MHLLSHINILPRLRTPGLPAYLRRVCLIVGRQWLDLVEPQMRNHSRLHLEMIAVADFAPGLPSTLTLPGRPEVPLAPLDAILDKPYLELAVLPHPSDKTRHFAAQISRILAPFNLRLLHICTTAEDQVPHLRGQPEYFARNRAALENVYAMLADHYSREIFAARVKSILTGDFAFLPVSAQPEYHHPLVRPEPGDIMLDGGVSAYVDAQIQFSHSVGSQGAVYGFEPIPSMFESAKASLASLSNYHLFNLGLGKTRETAFFRFLEDSSRVASPGKEGAILCSMLDIDSFVAEHNLNPTLIKLDVEGSELDALRGASGTIVSLKPKLIVCLYHKPQDLYEVPTYLRTLVPDYQLYIAHSSAGHTDTILYAKAP